MVLYTAVGSYGHAAVVNTDRKFAFQRHIACVYPDTTSVIPEFVGRWLNSDWARGHADRVALGNAQKTVTLGELATFPIPVPPIDEQERISEAADGVASRIALEHAHRVKLGAIKQGLMDDLLTGAVRVKTAVRVSTGASG
jgi:type I restriction enzyme S subunit